MAAHDRTTQNPLDMFYYWESLKPDSNYLSQFEAGRPLGYTWAEVGSEARKIASALQSIGMKKSERVCILSNNCPHWIISDLAIMMAGGASAPAFTTMTSNEVQYILEHSGSKILFVGKTDNWPSLRENLPSDIITISLPFSGITNTDYSWESLLNKHKTIENNPTRDNSEELTTIYTSGSTGKPKGVMINFGSASHSATNLSSYFSMSSSDRMISYLPLAHGFERAIVGWMSLTTGFSVGFNGSKESFSSDIKTVAPTVFQCVPRLWTKFQESLLVNFDGQEVLDGLLNDPTTKTETIENVKKALGLDQCRLFFTGSAPTPEALHKWYRRLEMPLCELYGQSELLCGSANVPWDSKPGTLGKPITGTQIKISEQGEILLRSDSMMSGYLNEPEKTAKTIIDGWIHTGDKGTIDEDGFLSVTGRLKEIFKTAKGKYVAPLVIESGYITNLDIELTCAIGSGLPQPAVVVNLSEQGRAKNRDAVQESIRSQVLELNRQLHDHEKVACVIISDRIWDADTGLITHTMKVKREAIEKQFQEMAENSFSEGASVRSPLIQWS